jgi:hypothetical protein
MADRETTERGRDTRGRSKTKATTKTVNGRGILLAAKVDQESARRKEAETMAEQDSGNVRLFSDFADSVLAGSTPETDHSRFSLSRHGRCQQGQ